MNFTVEKKNDAALVRCDVPSTVDWSQYFLVRGDAHHDSPQSDHGLERLHLEEARKRGAEAFANPIHRARTRGSARAVIVEMPQEPELYLRDQLHPNEAGALKLAEMVAKAIETGE